MALDTKKIRSSTKNWFFDLLNKMFNKKPNEIKNVDFLETHPVPIYGEMYFYRYDAKYKKILPVWDEFPLIIYAGPSKKNSANFIGLNLHYLNIPSRIQVLSILDDIQSDAKYDSTMKVKFIDFLLNDPRMKVCIKEYIGGNVVGRVFYYVKREAWENVAVVPGLENWKYNTGPGKRPY